MCNTMINEEKTRRASEKSFALYKKYNNQAIKLNIVKEKGLFGIPEEAENFLKSV